MPNSFPGSDLFHISPRFRRSIEERIERFERDAESDERNLVLLRDPDHIRRHRRLIMVQRSEALRMRIFLEKAMTRLPRPLIGV